MATSGAPDVNKPTDVKLKESDVNRKLQFYGIIAAFQAGKVPSNDQIDVALNSFLASRALANPSEKLSEEGRSLVADVREVVKQAQHLLLSKNEGNLLQDFIWQTTHFDTRTVAVPGAPVDKDVAKQHGDKALEGLRTLGTLLITNGQFRKLLQDFTVLLRDIAGDAASNAANKVRPSQEALDNIDAPAADNTWHDAPDFSKENMKNQLNQAKGAVYKGKPTDDAKAVAASGTAGAHPTGSTDPRDLAATDRAGLDARSGVAGAKNALQERLDANVPDDTQEAAKSRAAEYRARTRAYLGKKMPNDRRDQTIWRLKKMVLECQQHPDYKQAIETLLDLAETYGRHAKTLGSGGTGTVKDARSNLAQAEADLKTLIERFANGTSSDDLFASIKIIAQDADRDPELKEWFKSMDRYIRRLLLEEGYILDESSNRDWHRLYDQGNYLLREKYKTHTDRILDEIKFLADQFDQDSQNKAFAASLTKLFNDLGNDENGKPVFKKHLVKDLTEIIIPAVLENIAYVPIPRIEYSDPQVDAVIENLVIESDNLTPNVLEVESENQWRWGRKKVGSKSKHKFEVKVAGVQMDLRDVSFYVKRKQGFPSITDKGVANILMAGDGFTFKLKMASADKKDSQSFFKVEKVDVDIKNLKIKMVKSDHKLLFNIAKPLMLRVLRPAIGKAIGQAIKDNFNKLDSILYHIKVEADRALEEAREDPENVPNIYQRYYTAAQKQILQGKQKAEDIVADKKVNYAVTKEDSMFPDISLPGGISTKATEYKELARKGEKWESPVFSIGTASKSSNIPSAPQVVRKSHATAGSGPFSGGSGALGGGQGAINGGPGLMPATSGIRTSAV